MRRRRHSGGHEICRDGERGENQQDDGIKTVGGGGFACDHVGGRVLGVEALWAVKHIATGCVVAK